MLGDSRYALEKLSLAVHYLAVSPGDVRRRLKRAYREFHAVSENDFPAHLRDDWNWIKNQLIRFGPVLHADGTVFVGALENTLGRIKNSTGTKIAERIISLHSELESYLEDDRSSS